MFSYLCSELSSDGQIEIENIYSPFFLREVGLILEFRTWPRILPARPCVRPLGAIRPSPVDVTSGRTTGQFERLPSLSSQSHLRSHQTEHARGVAFAGTGLARRDWPGSPNLQAAAASRRRRRGEEDGQIARNVVTGALFRGGATGRPATTSVNGKAKRSKHARCTRPSPAVVSSERPRRKNRGGRARDGEVASCRFPVTAL